MPIRPASFMASAAVFCLSAPAVAQDVYVDDRYADVYADEPVAEQGRYEGNWEGSWQDAETWQGEWRGTYTDAYGQVVEAEYSGVWMGETRFVSQEGHVLMHDGDEWHGRYGDGHHARRYRDAHAPGLGYTTAQRDQWLAECRYLMAGSGGYYDSGYDRGPDGALIGGVLGAVAGGVAGNRIADGDRLLGTVVGAGLGGVAGAAIGDALDDEGDGYYDGMDREELWAARYCEAYLQRHEMGAGYGYAQPVMMVPVRMSGHGHHARNCGPCGEEAVIVEEEIVEIERPAPRPVRRVAPAPQPRSGKRTPIN